MNMGKNFGSRPAPASAPRYPDTVDCEERASIDWARLIRGSRSRLNAVARFATSAFTVSSWAPGWKKLTTLIPSGLPATSSGVGACTLATTVAPLITSAMLPATVAPLSA
jgi:hypothetical protein